MAKKKKSKKKPWEYGRNSGRSKQIRPGGSSSKKDKDKKKSYEPPQKKKKKSSGGSKKVKKAAQRITGSLQMQRDQGNDRAQQIRNMKIERSPKNIGEHQWSERTQCCAEPNQFTPEPWLLRRVSQWHPRWPGSSRRAGCTARWQALGCK